MALWCRDLPVVRVPRGTPKPHLTLVYPYYENIGFLETQVATWRSYPAAQAARVTVIVVDDGSPVPCRPVVAPPCRVRLFRIGVDVRWNWLAARNIGAYHAEEGWIVLTDMDHVLPADTLASVLTGAHDPAVIYAFSRREHTGARVTPHSASFLLTRQTFWQTGGYDETLSGYYGTDGDFRRRAARVARMAVLTDDLVRHEYVGDSSTTRYQRKQPQDAAVRRLIAQRRPGWRPKVRSFPYVEVTA